MDRQIKRPWLTAILLALIPVLMATLAGVVIVIVNIGEPMSFVIQAAAFAISLIIGLVVARSDAFEFDRVGLRRVKPGSYRGVYYLIPALLIECAALVTGLAENLNAASLAILAVFTLLVGFSEELFYRGLVMRCFYQFGVRRAVLYSSLLFAIGHAVNALAGASVFYVTLQVLFAFLFGLVAAMITVGTGSILPAVCWHFTYDFVAYISNDGVGVQGNYALVVLGVQVVILVVYAVMMRGVLDGGNGNRTGGVGVL
ncbi:hypothetical protein FACS1894184_20080 [Clostridia bacterium]|nr:hypothetical protein FACS1894184_20080 [Clostridia bacterium]